MNKKQIAALAGVLHYLKAEEERNRAIWERTLRPYSMANRWSAHGRHTIMQLRYRTQRRILSRYITLPFVNDTVLCRGSFPHRVKNLVITQNRLISQARLRRVQ